MVVLAAVLVITLSAGPCLDFLADQTFLPEPLLVDVLDALDVDEPILLLEIALGNPYGAHVMHPHKVADRLLGWVGRLGEVVVVRLLLSLGALPGVGVLLLVLVVGAPLRILVVLRVSVLEKGSVDVDGRALQGPTLHMAQRAWHINSRWPKRSTHLAHPIIGRDFGQAHASLVQADVAHGAKNNEVVLGVVPICAHLALGILHLPLSLFLFDQGLAVTCFLNVHFLLPLLHVVQENLFVRVHLVHQLQGVAFYRGHKGTGQVWQLRSFNRGL